MMQNGMPNERFSVNGSGVTVPVMTKRALEDGATERRMAMATRLTQVRSVLSGNQAAVARAVGCGVNTWNRYEKGVRDVDAYALAEFCRRFGDSPADQIGLAGWVLLGRRDQLNADVREQLVLAYPEIAQRDTRPGSPKTHQSSGTRAPTAQH